VDIVRGLATLAGMRVVPVPGQTGLWDTDYASEGRTAVKALLEDGFDFVYVHIEAPDEATHAGLLEKKLLAIERMDRDIVGPLLSALEARGEPFRVLLSPDHATTLATKTHAPDAVPFALFGAGIPASGGRGYNEAAARAVQGAAAPVPGHRLLDRLFAVS
jgi:2,3-bisphosphoglycerate-independent phosphoglycerate mutase